MIRRTHYDYAHINSSSVYQPYRDSNIADLELSEIIYNGNNNMVAETLKTYDDTALISTAGIQATGHDYSTFGASNTVRGNLTTVSHWRNTDGVFLRTVNTYDDLGNLRSTQDPNGNVTSFSYTDNWSNTNCLPSGFIGLALVTQVTNALNQNTQTTYYPCTGLKQATRDPNDIAAGRSGTTYTFDLMNRPLTVNYADGGQSSFCYSDISSASCYNGANPLQVVTTRKITTSTNLLTTSVFDSLGRIVQTQTNSDPFGVDYVDRTYDSLGRVAGVSNP